MPRSASRTPTRKYFLGAVGVLIAILVTENGDSGIAQWELHRVRKLHDDGRFQASLPLLRRALERDPASPEARYRHGLALLRSGEPSRATWPLQAAAASPEYAELAAPLLASAYLQTQNFDEALRVANGLLSREPEHVELRTLRARTHLAARRPEDALLDTRWLRARGPGDFEVSLLHAAALVGAGELEEARATYEDIKALGRASGDADLQAIACLAPAGFAEEFLGDAERAQRLYDDCAPIAPANRVALQLLVSFLERAGKPEQAAAQLRSAARAAPEDLSLQSLLAHFLAQQGDPGAAEAVLREAAIHHDSPEAWRLLANQQRANGAVHRALSSLETALARTENADPILRFERADLLIDLGELDDAAASMSGVQPHVFEQLILGRCALLEGNAARALQHFETGLADWPDHARARKLAGQAAWHLGDRARAISHLREAVGGDPNDTTTALGLAGLLEADGQHREALRIARSLHQVSEGPPRWRAGLVAAMALTGLGHNEEARKLLEGLAVTQTDSQRAEALAGLALLETRTGRTDHALELLDRARASHPAEGQYAYQAVRIALRAGKLEVAEERLRGLVVRHPALLQARNDLAWLLADRGVDLDLALALAEQASAGLEDPETLDTLGWVHLKRGEFRQAREALEAALALRPESAPTQHRLALATRGEITRLAGAPPGTRAEATNASP